MTAEAQQPATLADRNELVDVGNAPQQSAASPEDQIACSNQGAACCAAKECEESADCALSSMIDERVKELQHQTNCQSSLKAREAAKRQKKRLKELSKLLACKSKPADEVQQALYQAAVAATKEKFAAEGATDVAETARLTAVRALAERDDQLRRSTQLQDKLQALCRELQNQVKQMAKEHELRMAAEAQKRSEAVEQMGDMMNGITERLNEQQENMEKTCKDNEQLRTQLTKMAEVAKLSEQLRGTVGEENERIKAESLAREDLFNQQEEKMLTQLKASHTQQKVAAEQVAELQGALKTAADTVKDCHKTNIALVSEKKDLLSINLSLRDECTRARARISALEDQSMNKETQIKKLQMMKQRLESLCRYQQDQLKDRAAQKAAPEESEPVTEAQVEASEEAAESTATFVESKGDTACAHVVEAEAVQEGDSGDLSEEDDCRCCTHRR